MPKSKPNVQYFVGFKLLIESVYLESFLSLRMNYVHQAMLLSPSLDDLIREGLADTLALMGALGYFIQSGEIVAADLVNRISKELFKRMNEDWCLWAYVLKS